MRVRERWTSAVIAVAMAVMPLHAQGAAFTVQSRTEAQAYQFRGYRGTGPDDTVLLPRRRLVQYLGADGFELVTGQDVGFESSLRIYADFGLPKGEAARLDGLHTEGLDLLYANLFYRSGGLELRAGRQVYIDLMDYMAFDGARVRYMRRVGPRLGSVGAVLYGGLWVRAASLLGSSVYQLDGVRETDARRVALGVPDADRTLDDFEPVFGGKILLEDLGRLGISTTLAYRRSQLAGKITSERAAVELRYGKGRGLNGWAGADYDLFQARIAQARLELRYDTTSWAASTELLRFSPIYTSDSIFYYFVSAPRDEVRVRGDLLPPGPYRFYVTALGAKVGTQINSSLGLADFADDPAGFKDTQLGAGGGIAARWERTRAALDVTQRAGWGGKQLWLDLTAGYTTPNQRLSLDSRFTVASISDQMNALLKGQFYGLQVWSSYLLTPAARFSLMVEQNVNPFVRSDTKAFLLFDLRAEL